MDRDIAVPVTVTAAAQVRDSLGGRRRVPRFSQNHHPAASHGDNYFVSEGPGGGSPTRTRRRWTMINETGSSQLFKYYHDTRANRRWQTLA
jgi:hypothetical protein